MRIALCLVMLAACGGGGPEHWSKQPLETFEGTNEGVTFTIQLPKGMKKSSVESKYDVSYAYHADVGGESRTFAPSISVNKASKKQTLEEAMKGESDIKAPTDVVFKEELPDGWTYAIENSSYKGREDYLVRAQKTVGDVTLYCSARVYPMTKGGKAKGDIPLVAKMCHSLKTK